MGNVSPLVYPLLTAGRYCRYRDKPASTNQGKDRYGMYAAFLSRLDGTV